MGGLHICKLPAHFTLNRYLMELFVNLRMNCVLDVGAHHGEYARNLRKLHYENWIISFEPCRESFEVLRENMSGDLRWRGYQYALGDAETTAAMNVFAATDLNSFCTASRMVSATSLKRHFTPQGQEVVTIKRLDKIIDSVLADVFGPRPVEPARIYLKMDTQGFDTKVIRGASGCLARILAFQSELPCRQLYEGVPSMGDALNEYESLGYIPTFMFPVTLEENGLIAFEFDCVMKKI
jgi:FkbM family methyltransferase